MELTTLALVVVAGGALVAARLWENRPGHVKVKPWASFAEHSELEYDNSPRASLRGEVDGIHLFITTTMRSRGHDEGGDPYTLVAATLPSAPRDLLLARTSADALQHEVAGIEEPTRPTERFSVGHSEFDRGFTARGHSSEAVKFASRRGIPETLMEFSAPDDVEVYGGALLVSADGIAERVPQIEVLVERVVKAAKVLEGAAHPGTFCTDRHMKRWLWAEDHGFEYDSIASMASGVVNDRAVRVHFGVAQPMTVVEAATQHDLGLRVELPLPAEVPEPARNAIQGVTTAGDKVHFLEVVRIRRDETVPFPEIDLLLDAIVTAAGHIERTN